VVVENDFACWSLDKLYLSGPQEYMCCDVGSRTVLQNCFAADFSPPQLCTKFGECAVLHAGPAAWNSLPEHIRTEPDIGVFRKLLKTRLFDLAFNVH